MEIFIKKKIGLWHDLNEKKTFLKKKKKKIR